MIRTFVEEIHCDPTELADEFWNMSDRRQLLVLSCLNTLFFKGEDEGDMQMAAMYLELNKCDAARKVNVKHFVSKLYEYLVEE